MLIESDNGERDGILDTLQWGFVYGVVLIAVAYAGSLWTESRTKTAELAQCEAMLPNLAIDCPLAAQVAECAVTYPGAKCEVTR